MNRFPRMQPLPLRLVASLAATVALLCLSHYPASLTAQTTRAASEQQVKAAYLYKFAGYVEWPQELFQRPDSPLSIGVLGARTLSDELAQLTSNRTVGDRPISVRQVTADDSLEGLHILFIADGQSHQLPRLASIARTQSILTVTESDNALGRGSIINFRTSDQRIRFEIALDTATASQLRLSSRLLAVAERVQSRTP